MDFEFNAELLKPGVSRIFRDGCSEALDFGARHRFGDAYQRALGQFRILRAQGNGPMIFSRSSAELIILHRARKFEHELVERGAGEHAPHAGNFFEFRLCESSLGQILQRTSRKPSLPIKQR